MTNHQTLHREADPRVRRSLAVALVVSAVLVVGALGAVGLRVQQVHLAYQLDGVRAERAQTETLIRQLEVEVATLRSPGRIEARARQLGMTAPGRDQIRLAREYVAGATGVAGVVRSRVAGLAGHPRPEPDARPPAP
ncbi:MAG TPA: cell division protein FtsL [Methylomirabilota bacterium]|nr:cell division protein FtsL [Methylomirabilota bacterium]